MQLLFLLKFGTRKNIEDLYNNGTIYMNSINYFKRIEGNEQRRDDREGVLHIKQISEFKIEGDGKMYRFGKKAGERIDFVFETAQYREEATDLLGNIYSTYTITDEFVFKTNRVDPRCAGFGDTVLIINYPITFLKRIRQALEERNFKYKFGYVKYYDERTYHGDLGWFYKPDSFAYQSEHRIAVMHDKDEPVIIKIGSLADISAIVDMADLDTLKVEVKEITQD